MSAGSEVSEVLTAMQANEGDQEIYADLLERFGVPSRYQVEFARFIETGEASPDFTNFLDEDRNCQEAIEQAFLRRMDHVRQVLQALTNDWEPAVAD